jgi:RNA polymerase sigma-70 factor (ECF subfamily)
MAALQDSYISQEAATVRNEDLVARYRAPLRSYFRKRVDNPADIDDLVQELFLRLLDRSGETDLANPDGYIFQAAANLLRDRSRRNRTKDRFVVESKNGEDRFEEISPERVLLGKDAIERVQNALLALPERTRTVFVLHRFEHLKYREIADRLEISISSVEKHMASALTQIASRLDHEQ